MRHRPAQVLASEDLKLISTSDLVDLIKFFKHVRADLILDAVFKWGEDMDGEEFSKAFRNRFYKHIQWENLPNESMAKLHGKGVLTTSMENEAMMRVLSRKNPLPEMETDTVCTVDMRLTLADQAHCNNGQPRFGRLFLRTVTSFHKNIAGHKVPRKQMTFLSTCSGEFEHFPRFKGRMGRRRIHLRL